MTNRRLLDVGMSRGTPGQAAVDISLWSKSLYQKQADIIRALSGESHVGPHPGPAIKSRGGEKWTSRRSDPPASQSMNKQRA